MATEYANGLSLKNGNTGRLTFDAIANGGGLLERVDELEKEVGLYIPPNANGITEASAALQNVLAPLSLIDHHTYTYSFEFTNASDAVAYMYVVAPDGVTAISSLTIPAGTSSGSRTFTANANYAGAFLAFNTARRSLEYSVKIIDESVSHNSRIDDIENTIGIYTPPNASGTTAASGSAQAVLNNVNLIDHHTYTYSLQLNAASDAVAYVYVVAADGQTVISSKTIQAGETSTSGTFTANTDYTGAYIAINSSNRVLSYYVEIIDESISHNNRIDDLEEADELLSFAPVDVLPEWFINTMAYHPLGQLQNPYLCLTCDDGAAELETYTIPMLISKGVPCTFGLWATSSQPGQTPAYNPSVVLQSESGRAAVLNAISNGCEVAQHGATEWTEWTGKELVDFFDREKTAFDALGIEVKGAICPSHNVNNKVRVVAGGRFGSVRSGYNGWLNNADRIAQIPGDVLTPYGFLTGARSNCYSYTSFNVIGFSLEQLKSMLDDAITNNMCMIVYWHDNDLTAAQKADLEGFIDYAKTTAVNFCTLSEIPTLD